MIVKRLAAVLAAVGLILGAVAVRGALDDGETEPRQPRTLVCASELATVCRRLDPSEIEIQIAEAGDTLERLSSASGDDADVIWLTFSPFPAMIDSERQAAGLSALDLSSEVVATSDIALVSPTGGEVAGCGDPADWRCLVDLDLRIGFAGSPRSGSGLLGLTQAALAYDDAPGIRVDDAQFGIWLRGLVRSVSSSQLSAGTAIATLQTRPSSLDVAVGPVALLGVEPRDDLSVAYAAPMIRADVVVSAAPGVSVPAGVSEELGTALVASGWSEPGAASTTGGVADPVDASTVLAVLDLWREFR